MLLVPTVNYFTYHKYKALEGHIHVSNDDRQSKNENYSNHSYLIYLKVFQAHLLSFMYTNLASLICISHYFNDVIPPLECL